MGFTPERRKFLVDALGEEKVMELEQDTEGKAKALEDLGVEFKDVLDTLERINGDEEEPEGHPPPGDEPEKAVDYGKLSGFLERQQQLIEDQGKAIKGLTQAVEQLARSDDEKVAQKLRPKVDIEKSTIPVWERSLSRAKETEIDEEKDKDLVDSKPGIEQHWLSEALGTPADNGGAVPRS